jgi:hypothetical protein
MNSVLHLMKLARQGWDKRYWYDQSQSNIIDLCDHFDWDWEDFCEVLAVTSPKVSVRRNVRITLMYMHGIDLPKDVTRSHRAAFSYWEKTKLIRGPKTLAFAEALCGNTDAVPLDVWMARALGIEQRTLDRKAVRQSALRRIRFGAALAGLTPRDFQAAVWCGTLKKAGRNVPVINPMDEYELILKRGDLGHDDEYSSPAAASD